MLIKRINVISILILQTVFVKQVFAQELSQTEETVPKFLNIPFNFDTHVSQGWIYSWDGTTHGATDFSCRGGIKILAAADGLAMQSVQKPKKSGDQTYGNFVFIKHDNGYSSLYGHLNKISEKIKSYPDSERGNTNYSEWTPVKKGEYIGDCGMSGTDNVHLHFEVTTGKYSVGRVDSYDLYKTKEFYPPNASYVAMGPKYLWANDPPVYDERTFVQNSVDSGTNSNPDEKKGIWDTIKGLFTTEEVVGVKGAQENAPTEIKDVGKLNLSFVDKKINLTPKPEEETKVVLNAKNTGTKIWKRNEISLNVIGGAGANSIFRHPSWITDLRPTLLDKTEVKPNETGTFTFSIKGLIPGSYTLKLMTVEVGTWKQIGNEQSVIAISVAEPVEEKQEVVETPKPFEGIVKGIKDFADTVIDKIGDVIKSIPNIFGGGGGGSGSSSSNENTQANPETVQKIEVVPDTEPPGKPELSVTMGATSTIDLAWHASDTGGSPEMYYLVQKKTEISDWITLLEKTTSTSYLFPADTPHEYLFRVEAMDSAGNISVWSDEQSIIVDWSKEIVMNEVAWAGSSGACADHEWIELYNPSSNSVSLQGWKLDIDTDSSVQTVPLIGSVEGYGYYLISHLNTFVSVVVPDTSLPQNIRLADTGARLVLKDQSGNTVDEVDQSVGWLGGNTGSFPRTLERISAESPSFSPSTWKSSDSARYGIASGLCGQMTGSPRMNNNGYAYVSDATLGFYPHDADGVIVFSKEQNPYVFSNVPIHQGEKIKFSQGTVFAGVSADAQINVDGELMIDGTENNPVILTSRNDVEHVTSTGALAGVFTGQQPKAGDWQNIVLSNTGKLTINHALLKYGGNRYGVSISCQACARSQVISNQGGNVSLSHTEISDGHEAGTTGKPDALIYSDGGVVTLDHVELHYGKRALHIDGNTEVNATSVTIHDFDLTDKVIYFQQKMPSLWENIVFTGNSPSYAYSPIFTVTSSYVITPDQRFEFTTVLVNSGATLTVNGGNLYAYEIKVNGNLNVFGGEAGGGGEIGGGASPSSTFSHIVFYPGSSGNFSHVRMRGGGYLPGTSSFPFTSPRPYMLWIDGASVIISNSYLTDARRTGGVVVLRNGNLTIKDSELGWYTGYNKLDSWKDYGIVGNTQSTIRLENVNFRKMDYVIELGQGSVMTYGRMTKDNFIDLYPAFAPQKNWFPISVFPF